VNALLGTTPAVFIGITVVLVGFAAWATGEALAATWRPWRQLAVYVLLLGAAARFLIYGLFQGALFSLSGYLLGTLLLLGIGSFAYLATRARKMVTQYPWLYERAGLFGWRERG